MASHFLSYFASLPIIIIFVINDIPFHTVGSSLIVTATHYLILFVSLFSSHRGNIGITASRSKQLFYNFIEIKIFYNIMKCINFCDMSKKKRYQCIECKAALETIFWAFNAQTPIHQRTFLLSLFVIVINHVIWKWRESLIRSVRR